jgi:plasmid maintenance system antidote protein VapI
MKFAFDIIGVSPVLYFFNQQVQNGQNQQQPQGVKYLGSNACTLDAFIETAESVTPKMSWNTDEVVETVINFWINNSDSIRYWKSRLQDAGKDNLIVSRLADIKALQSEFEFLLNQDF